MIIALYFFVTLVWIIVACLLAFKWLESDESYIFPPVIWIACILFLPLVLIITITRQVFFEKWR